MKTDPTHFKQQLENTSCNATPFCPLLLLRQVLGECNLLEKWGAECDPLMQSSLRALNNEEYRHCHRPGQVGRFVQSCVPTPCI